MLHFKRLRFPGCGAAVLLLLPAIGLHAQAPAAAARQLGTVKAVEGNMLTLSTAAGATVMVSVGPEAPVLQLPPGSTDLKAATPATLGSIAVGDRVLVTGKAGEAAPASPLNAARVVLMKSSAIAARQTAQQADWQKRGSGGIVKAVDGPVLTMAAGASTETVKTSSTTVFRRYANDSVKFEDAKPAALAAIKPGDQISVRGDKSDDGSTITAEEVVSGTFQNLSGVIASADVSAGSITLKDLATKRNVTVKVTANSDLRNLPAQAAASFAARTRGPGTAGAPAAGAAAPSSTGPPSAGTGDARPRSAGLDLSRLLSRLPTQTVADLHAGEAVMIVASQGAGADLTAITLLSGVEPILSATPSGSQPITLSPWTLGAPGDAGSQ